MASVAKQFAVIAVLVAAAVGVWRYGPVGQPAAEARRGGERPAPEVVVEAAARETVERAISAVGAARPVRSVRLATAATGRVASLGVSGGEHVAQGAVVLRLEDATPRAALAEAEAEADRARAALRRLEALAADGRVPENRIEEARAQRAAAAAARAAAEKALADRTLRAPFAGVVGFPEAEIGAWVQAGDAIVTLDDLSALDVEFSAPERFFSDLAIGAPVRATTDALPGETLTGAVDAIDRRIDPATRSFRARARIPNPQRRVPAGAFLRVRLVLDRRESVTAPEEAVVIEAGAPVVLVAAPDGEGGWRAERRAVTLGQRMPGAVEIRSGLEAGERVVTRGVLKARDGAPIRIRRDAADPAPDAAPGA